MSRFPWVRTGRAAGCQSQSVDFALSQNCGARGTAARKMSGVMWTALGGKYFS